MTKKTQELSEKELRDFVELIGKPTFNFMLKRIQTYILKDKKNQDMSVNTFISILIAALATVDANLLFSTAAFYRVKVGQDIDFEKLRMTHIKNLNEQLGVKVH